FKFDEFHTHHHIINIHSSMYLSHNYFFIVCSTFCTITSLVHVGAQKIMTDVDDEVRRAEQMALAVASTPNLRASEAREMLLINNNQQLPVAPNRASRERLNSADEEVRRAREMAMAVAALGTERGAGMKAEDIRMAVADVMRDPDEKIKKEKKERRKAEEKRRVQQQIQREASIQNQEHDDDQSSDCESMNGSSLHKIIEDLLRPPWILSDQNFLVAIIFANLSILYVTLSSASSYTKFSNAVFVFNMTVAILCVMEKKNTKTSSIDPVEENQTNNDIITEEENKKNQEALIDEMEKRLRSKNKITLEWLPDVQFSDADLNSLLELQPESTLAERRRFLKARKGVIKAASAQLGSYIQWRCQNKIDEFFPSTFTTDEEDWERAARGAMEIANTGATPASQRKLPRIVSIYGGDEDELVLCRNGARVVHVLPCQLDTTIAPATTYALALAMYLDRKLDRNHTEKVTVVIDIRSGKGWPNPSSVSLVPFIKLVVGSLNSYFPERLSRCILFPLPTTATLIFNRAKGEYIP
ncbi:MAG: hypothetical protein ACI90V_012124, partial [Bacillariaceae sp.]